MVNVTICVGTNCSFQGGLDILDYLENDIEMKNQLKVVTSNCIGKACKPDNSPIVMVEDEMIARASLDQVLLKIREKIHAK